MRAYHSHFWMGQWVPVMTSYFLKVFLDFRLHPPWSVFRHLSYKFGTIARDRFERRWFLSVGVSRCCYGRVYQCVLLVMDGLRFRWSHFYWIREKKRQLVVSKWVRVRHFPLLSLADNPIAKANENMAEMHDNGMNLFHQETKRTWRSNRWINY